MARFFYISTLILLFMSNVTAAASDRFYERRHEGWFWYQDPKPEPEQEKVQEPEPETLHEADAPVPATQPTGPAPMTVEWFRENHDRFLHRAIDNPTEENVMAYHILHNAMMDKVITFANESQRIGWQYAAFDSQGRRPTTTRTNWQRQTAVQEVVQMAFDRIKERGGGLWFFHDDSVHSQNMAEDLQRFGRRHDVDMIAFSLADGVLPGSFSEAFVDIRFDEGQARAAGVTHAPALIIALPPNELHVLAHGYVTSEKIRQRMIALGPRIGVLTEAETDLTRSVVTGAPRIRASDFERYNDLSKERMLEVFHETQSP